MTTFQKILDRIQFVSQSLLKPFLKIKNQQWRSLALATVLASIAWLVVFIVVPLAPFGAHSLCTNDGFAQYMPFLSELWSVVHEEGSLFYTFNGGLGQNFFLTMAYYLFSPITWLVLLFSKSQIPAAANLIIVLKNILVIAIMAWYLPSKSKKSSWTLAASCALAYGFGFYFLGYAVNFMWMDCIALVPLMLYGIERLNTRKGRLIYIVSLALGVLTNFYMGAIVCIFLAFYYLFIRLYFSKKGIVDFGWFVACSLSAVFIASVVLIPVVQGMLMANASRMSPPDFEWFNDAKYIASRLLPDAEVIRISHNRGTMNLYMGTAALIGTLLFVVSGKASKRYKLGIVLLVSLYFVSLQQSWLNYLFHGFYLQRQVPNRYGFVIGLLVTLMMYQGLLNLNRTKMKWIVLASGLSAIIYGVLFVVSGSSTEWLGFVLPTLCILYGLLAIFKHKAIMAALIVIESYCGLIMCAPGKLSSNFIEMDQYIKMAHIGEDLDGFGRTEIFCSDIANAPMLYGIQGISAFNSVINPKTAGLLGKLGFASGENYYRMYGLTPLSGLFLDVQSVITNTSTHMPYPYQLTQVIGNMAVWRSAYDIPIGLCLENSQQTIGSTNKFMNLNHLFANVYQMIDLNVSEVTGHEWVDRQDDTYQIQDLKENEEFSFTLDRFEAQNAFVYAKMSGAKRFIVHKNGTILIDNKYEGNIIYLGDVTMDDLITITIQVDEDQQEGKVLVQGATSSNESIDAAANYFIEHGLKEESIRGNTITGTYSSAQDETMIFTIPYDEGWSAYVDGQQVDIQPWQNALVSVDLKAGDHSLRLVYTPAGLKTGRLLSGLGILCSIFVIYGFKKKNKAGKEKIQQESMESK